MALDCLIKGCLTNLHAKHEFTALFPNRRRCNKLDCVGYSLFMAHAQTHASGPNSCWLVWQRTVFERR